jgi:hypothetical protein
MVARSIVMRASALVAATPLLLPGSARAETEAIRIEYQGIPGCPGSSEFLRQVFRRTSSARLVPESESARTFVIVIEKAASGLVGSLVIRETNGTTVARKVTGASCADVAGVLALATALAIDPNAALAPDDGEGEPADPKPAVPVPASPQPDPKEPEPPPPSEEEPPFSYGAAIGPSLVGLVAPRVAVGGSVAVHAFRTDRAALSSFGATVSFLRALDSRLGSATISHQLLFVRPEACLLALGPLDEVALMPCVGTELGAVTARASNLAVEESRTRFWATADWIVRLRVVPADAWFISLDASLVLPITRWSFVVRDPTTRVHDVPPIAAAGSAMLGLAL